MSKMTWTETLRKKLYIAKDLTADIVVISAELCKSVRMDKPM